MPEIVFIRIRSKVMISKISLIRRYYQRDLAIKRLLMTGLRGWSFNVKWGSCKGLSTYQLESGSIGSALRLTFLWTREIVVRFFQLWKFNFIKNLQSDAELILCDCAELRANNRLVRYSLPSHSDLDDGDGIPVVMVFHGWAMRSISTFRTEDDYWCRSNKVGATQALLDAGYAVFAPSASAVIELIVQPWTIITTGIPYCGTEDY